MRKTIFRNTLLVLLGSAGLVVFVLLVDSFFPHRAANVRLTRSQAIRAGERFMRGLGYDLDGYHVVTSMEYDSEAFPFLQQRYGFGAAQEMVRYKPYRGLEFSWRVFWFENLPQNAPQQRFLVLLSGRGRVAGFQHEFPTTSDWPRPERAHLDEDEAFEVAMEFIRAHEIDLEGFEPELFTSTRKPRRTDHIFRWRNASEFNDSYAEMSLVVQGDEIGSYFVQFEIPEETATAIKRRSGTEYFVDNVSAVIVLFLVGLLALSVFLKKYHEGEIEVRTAGLFFVILMTAYTLQAVLRFRLSATTWTIGELSRDGIAVFLFIILILIIRPILSIFGFAAWSVGESLSRERFPEKLTAVDALVHGRFFTLDTAASIFRGYWIGFLGLGIVAAYTSLVLDRFSCTIQLAGFPSVLTVPVDFGMPFLMALSGSLMAEMVFRLFFNVWLQQRLRLRILAVILSSVFWAFYVPGFWGLSLSLEPVSFEIGLWFALGIFFGIVFWRHDLLTAIIANFVMMGVMYSLPLVTAESASLVKRGIAALALISLPLVPMAVGFVKRQRFVFHASGMPAHIRRITERARMANELEIARQVQMRLLPKQSPKVPGFDISGLCIPARETGGDYFDFIELGPNRLGIVIGDVSGKGVPAAIYMTLTKGIVQSHADEAVSPKDVLMKVNQLLYKTIDRDSFVSLFYAVLDTERKTLVYSRAGHNPVLYFRNRTRQCISLEPEGIALGLDEGEKFRRVIRERKIRIRPGDLLVFYTDGFTEAMNSRRDEYGEERLTRVIQENHHKPVDAIFDAVIKDIKSFVKEAPQHDDMTMIFIKGQ